MVAKPTWVDPTSGWLHGFPKLWDGEGDMKEWLLKNGCPEYLIDLPIRMWYEEEASDSTDC